LDGIKAEKEQLKDLKEKADRVINTSYCNVHELKSIIFNIAQESRKPVPMRISIQSFGFKYGVPHGADLIMDVRFLENPFFIPELKDLDGEDEEVKDFVLNNDKARVFLQKYLDLLEYLIPLYEKERKAYLTIAVGCTGGRHRSVVIAQYIYESIDKLGKQVGVTHRDIKFSR